MASGMTAQSTSQHGPEPEHSEEPELSLLHHEDPDRSHVDLTPAAEGRGWRYYLRGLLLPRLPSDGDGLRVLVAALGTTISPYLLFWQSAHRIEDLRDEALGDKEAMPLARRRPPEARRKLRAARLARLR